LCSITGACNVSVQV